MMHLPKLSLYNVLHIFHHYLESATCDLIPKIYLHRKLTRCYENLGNVWTPCFFFVDAQSPEVPFFSCFQHFSCATSFTAKKSSTVWQLEKNKVTFIKRRLTITTTAEYAALGQGLSFFHLWMLSKLPGHISNRVLLV